MRKILCLRPSPALAIAMLALFVALSGTAVAAGVVPLAKRALVADNAGKLQGRTAAEVAALVAPPEVKTIATLTSVKSTAWSVQPGGGSDVVVACDPGHKATGGGIDPAGGAPLTLASRPSADGASWRIMVLNLSESAAASGTAYAVCLR